MSLVDQSSSRPVMQAVISAIVVLAVVAICITYLSNKAHRINRANLNVYVKSIAKNAAAIIDGDEHEKVITSGISYSDSYDKLLKPLVDIHNTNPDIFYLYTMKDLGDKIVYGLDTSTSKALTSDHELKPSYVGDIFDIDEATYQAWAERLEKLRPHVDREFSENELGKFLSAFAPFYNQNGEHMGFVGVAINPKYYVKYQRTITGSVQFSWFIALALSVFLGYLVYQKQIAIAALQTKLYKLSVTDSLTKSYNRRFFDQSYNEVQQVFSSKKTPYSIAVIDIDHFKKVNDQHGHSIGDQVLIEIASVIKKEIRSNDIFFRIGGEEFSILLVDTTLVEATKIVERIRSSVENYVVKFDENKELKITVSIGIAESQKDIDSMEAADEALYQAKEMGRNRVIAHKH